MFSIDDIDHIINYLLKSIKITEIISIIMNFTFIKTDSHSSEKISIWKFNVNIKISNNITTIFEDTIIKLKNNKSASNK